MRWLGLGSGLIDMKSYNILSLLIIVLSTAGCASYDKSIYLRNDGQLKNAEGQGLFEYRVMPKDELVITVSTSDPEVSAPFYRKIGQAKNQSGSGQGFENAKLLNYLVDNGGFIDYPVLGKIRVEGLTTRDCEALLRDKLQAHLSEVPNVTVRVANFKVSVLGEVANPGTYLVTDEQVNIFQALALAGDMTLFSVRDDVELLRTDADGNKQVIHLDLTKADIASSPYYYLQQNDIVYVRPTKARVSSNSMSNNTSSWISWISLLATVASLIIVSVR